MTNGVPRFIHIIYMLPSGINRLPFSPNILSKMFMNVSTFALLKPIALWIEVGSRTRKDDVLKVPANQSLPVLSSSRFNGFLIVFVSQKKYI